MGYAGDCGDFQAQFAGVQGSYVFSDGPGEAPTEHEFIDDYVCHAFPDDAYVTGAARPRRRMRTRTAGPACTHSLFRADSHSPHTRT